MGTNPYRNYINTPTSQREKSDPRQVQNSAGGYVFTVDPKQRLMRFLILGTVGGSYYVGERDLTRQNTDFLVDLIKSEPILVWDTVSTVSTLGLAVRQSPAIYTLALMFKHSPIKDVPATFKSEETGKFQFKAGFAYKAKTAKTLLPHVVRTFTHMAELKSYAKGLGVSGRAFRSAVQAWYKTVQPDIRNGSWEFVQPTKRVESVAYQAVKYRNREGWTPRDVLRTSHPKHLNTDVGDFILGKDQVTTIPVIAGFETMKLAVSVPEVLTILDTFPMLPWETIPTQFLREPQVWKKIFYNGQLNGQALVRNITRLSRIHAFDDMVFAKDYASKLADAEMIERTRLHPINFLNALVVHQEGQISRTRFGPNYGYGLHSIRMPRDWATVPVIVDALNAGFYEAFKHIEPANKRTLLGLDVSGSMTWSAGNGVDLMASQVAAAMGMAIARTEPYHMIRGFTDTFKDLGISSGMSLDQVVSKTANLTFGRTDCALPMMWAADNKVEVDTFIIITDSETWFGRVHPYRALRDYRRKMNIPAKLIVAGVTATEFTIADPSDAGMLDVVGFDSNAPRVMADFSAGRL